MEVTWKELQPSVSVTPRSSHSLAAIGKKAYAFGGEHEPRIPIDNSVHVLDLESCEWSVVEVASGDPPPPRVGVAMAVLGESLFVFGGRDAKHEELGELFEFKTESRTWVQLGTQGPSPVSRSYHAIAADPEAGVLYTFGGCGVAGRLNDLWAFSPASGAWEQLPSPPPESTCVPRGGPGLAVVGNAVWVVSGFCGKELGDVHRFDLERRVWEEVEVGPAEGGAVPSPRSVFGAVVVENRYIVTFGGEVDPSDQGHLGAGMFSDEVFALDTVTKQWLQPRLVGEGRRPEARGWHPCALVGSDSMLVYGGNSATNERLNDLWLLTVKA